MFLPTPSPSSFERTVCPGTRTLAARKDTLYTASSFQKRDGHVPLPWSSPFADGCDIDEDYSILVECEPDVTQAPAGWQTGDNPDSRRRSIGLRMVSHCSPPLAQPRNGRQKVNGPPAADE